MRRFFNRGSGDSSQPSPESPAPSPSSLSTTGPARPIRLVYCDEKGKFRMDPEAVATLQLVKEPVGVVSVCGRARQGKSFILNQGKPKEKQKPKLKSKQKQKQKQKLKPKGKKQKLKLNEKKQKLKLKQKSMVCLAEPYLSRLAPEVALPGLVVLREERLEDPQIFFHAAGWLCPFLEACGRFGILEVVLCQTTQLGVFLVLLLHYDRWVSVPSGMCGARLVPDLGLGKGTYSTQIFSLAVLLSSMFIYNQMGGIDEAALDRLSLVTEMTKHIRVRASGGRSSASELGQFSPIFVWLLRDFYLDLVEDNRKITPRDYLELALRPVQGSGRDLATKNEIRESIRALFPDRECFTLVRPLSSESELQRLDQIPLDKLRSEFRSGLDALTKFVFERTRPKQVGATVMTGPILARITQSFLDAINNGAVPTITSSWQNAAFFS
ncbi:unnamed protein product [Thlaspi arvense]|uniref:GB1/RHD3-type G domain-containing protein n=1 Tax=Thlaspi arvense TaxID=13288 RepID=A0AAU9SG17_THLAR|nr:unnamed protein product [Thlaspi arvense]